MSESEILVSNAVKEKDPKYLYYVDSYGNVARKLKLGSKRKKKTKREPIFNLTNLTIPKALVQGYVSRKEKRVIAYGSSGAMISMPKDMIGKEGIVIIIPKDSLDNLNEGIVSVL